MEITEAFEKVVLLLNEWDGEKNTIEIEPIVLFTLATSIKKMSWEILEYRKLHDGIKESFNDVKETLHNLSEANKNVRDSIEDNRRWFRKWF